MINLLSSVEFNHKKGKRMLNSELGSYYKCNTIELTWYNIYIEETKWTYSTKLTMTISLRKRSSKTSTKM